MNKVFIVSPADVATGGTELLQQLCAQINKIGKTAYMYYTEPYENSKVEARFGIYHNPIAAKIEDTQYNVVVVPETRIDLLRKIRRARIYIWWLSVDNYYGAGRNKIDLVHKVYYDIKDLLNRKLFFQCSHLVQSIYAEEFLTREKQIPKSQIWYLSDYLNHAFLDNARKNVVERENYILYNPKKGIEKTKLLMERWKNSYTWIPLQGFTPIEMQKIMKKSKVYIDFGNHPGKDRIPREAAICGCCIITGKDGAAANAYDVPIKDMYKFDDVENSVQAIAALIDSCMNEYTVRTLDFEEYRAMIFKEESRFEMDVRSIFG